MQLAYEINNAPQKDWNMCLNAGSVSIVLGLAIISIACYYLFYGLPRIAKKQDTATSIITLRVSSWFVIGGLIMMFLGILYLMGIIPWWS